MDDRLETLTRVTKTVSDIYAERCAVHRDEFWYLAKLSEEVGELNAAYLSATGRGRARGKSPTELKDAVEDELADVLAQVLLFADAQGIDMARAVARKWGKYMPVPEDAP